MATVTCHTERCDNVDRPVELALWWFDEDSDRWRHVDAVVCGACNNFITDVTGDDDEPPE